MDGSDVRRDRQIRAEDSLEQAESELIAALPAPSPALLQVPLKRGETKVAIAPTVADCCQRLLSSSRSASLGTLEAVHNVAPAASVAAPPQPFVVGLLPDSGRFCAESTQAPLAIGPPLFIVHCAFLS